MRYADSLDGHGRSWTIECYTPDHVIENVYREWTFVRYSESRLCACASRR